MAVTTVGSGGPCILSRCSADLTQSEVIRDRYGDRPAARGAINWRATGTQVCVGIGGQLEAVFRAELERLQPYYAPVKRGFCLGVAKGDGGYEDPSRDLVAKLVAQYPSVVAATQCLDREWGTVVVGPFLREDGGHLIAYGGTWDIVGRCTYLLKRGFFGGWRARYRPCPLE